MGFGDHPVDPKELKYVGYFSSEQCAQILEVTYRWPGSDWKNNPGIRWVAPNGTQWQCGLNLCPWFPVCWVSHCTLGFAFAHGSIKPSLQQAPVDLPYLHVQWARSMFQWYDYIAALFIPSIGTTDTMIKVEAPTNFMKRGLLDNTKVIQALNEEQIQMRKAVIQNQMALEILNGCSRRDLCYS